LYCILLTTLELTWLLNNIIKKSLVEHAKVAHGSLLSGGCIEKQIRCWKNCWYWYNIDICNKMHNILLHISILYQYQQFFQHRICFSIQPPDNSDPWPTLARSTSVFLIMLFNNQVNSSVVNNMQYNLFTIFPWSGPLQSLGCFYWFHHVFPILVSFLLNTII
jgi:hypothetical protein